MKKSEVLKILKAKALPFLVSGSLLTTPILFSGCTKNETGLESETLKNEEIIRDYTINNISDIYILEIKNKEYQMSNYVLVKSKVVNGLYQDQLEVESILDNSFYEATYESGLFDIPSKEFELQGKNVIFYPLEETLTYLYGYKETYTKEEIITAFNTKVESLKDTSKVLK